MQLRYFFEASFLIEVKIQGETQILKQKETPEQMVEFYKNII